MTYQGFGNGSDGAVSLSSHSPVDSNAAGSSGGTSLTATNASFAANKLIKIRQERGTGAGSWEINIISSYVAGTITTQFPLVNSYLLTGSNRAQVMVIPEYSAVTIASSFNVKAWNDSVGGHWCFMVAGKLTINSGVTISGKGRGFRGGNRETSGSDPQNAEQGDSSTGAPSYSTAANGSGGGGARAGGGGSGATGGGAGHSSAGGNGSATSGQTAGTGGSAQGSSDLDAAWYMGAGGGGGIGPGGNDQGGFGGPGGATFDIYAYEFENAGTFDFSGNNGNTQSQYGSYTDSGNPSPGGSQGSGGGGGAGGSGQVNAVKFTNSGSILSNGGSGGASNNPSIGTGGAGRSGFIRINACDYTNTGTISGSVTTNVGGHDFCQAFIHIY